MVSAKFQTHFDMHPNFLIKLVSIRIATALKPHRIADELILPTAKHIVGIIIREEDVKKLNGMHISVDIQFAKTDFSSISISQFWIKCLKSYSVISEPFLRLLLPFSPTYACETEFSGLLFIKFKYSIGLDAKDDVRCDVAQTIPRILDLVKQQQDRSSQ
ncbi:hypothetical protein RF11_06044 [Thelohanellus kitauei]|uniref:Uncharacterized protein n=1 Tax=Thelohanellus kitauei TaxID=669202 RepID=A0A0C2IEC2_THEKT|nr:hypothetical protein RF11_06044 [Thelohanellus kitauei]